MGWWLRWRQSYSSLYCRFPLGMSEWTYVQQTCRHAVASCVYLDGLDENGRNNSFFPMLTSCCQHGSTALSLIVHLSWPDVISLYLIVTSPKPSPSPSSSPGLPPLCFCLLTPLSFPPPPVHYMKKVEAPTPCTVTACASGPAARTSARTSDSFWSKRTHTCSPEGEYIIALAANTHKCCPLHYGTSSLWVQRSLTKKTSLAFQRAPCDLPDSRLTGFSSSGAGFKPTLIHNKSPSWRGGAW